jgi:hypothetical protein
MIQTEGLQCYVESSQLLYQSRKQEPMTNHVAEKSMATKMTVVKEDGYMARMIQIETYG